MKRVKDEFTAKTIERLRQAADDLESGESSLYGNAGGSGAAYEAVGETFFVHFYSKKKELATPAQAAPFNCPVSECDGPCSDYPQCQEKAKS